MTRVAYYSTADRPALELWLYDDDGSLINFATGYTFQLKLGQSGQTALLTKSSGIAGAAGAGNEPDGTPNIVVTWTAGELALTPGGYQCQLTATTGGLDRLFVFPFDILEVIS
jgi:hypothetical protein